MSCNSVVVKAALTAAQISPQWQGALPQCPALLTLGFPVAGLSQKHARLFEVIIGEADLLLAAALSSSLCGVLPRAVMNTRKHSLLLAFLLLSPSHIFF